MYSQFQSNFQDDNNNSQQSDTSFHMNSARFHCTPCNRQFSFLNPENGRAVCPRCDNVSTRRVDQTRNTTQDNNNSQQSDTSFHIKSERFYCAPCNRQFSFLNPENGRAVCPRCNNVSTRRADQSTQTQTRNTTQSRPQQQQPPQPRQRQTGSFNPFFMQPTGMFGGRQAFINPMSNGMFFAEPEYEQEYPQRYMSNDIGSLLSSMFGMNQPNNYSHGYNQAYYHPNEYPFEFFGGMQEQPSQQLYRVGDRMVTAEEYERLVQEFIASDPNDHGPAPASKEALKKLKAFEFDAEVHKLEDCSVCQENYQKGDKCVELPCEHAYHKDCVVEWLKRHDTCPVCRKPTDPNKMDEEAKC